jgi:hypothetical protein
MCISSLSQLRMAATAYLQQHIQTFSSPSPPPSPGTQTAECFSFLGLSFPLGNIVPILSLGNLGQHAEKLLGRVFILALISSSEVPELG